VQRYAHELLRAINDLVDNKDPAVAGLSFRLLAPAHPGVSDPAFANLPLQTFGRGSGHFWEQLYLPGALKRGELLFCPGNTAPLRSLQNRQVVVTVHSLSFRYFPEAYSLLFRLVYRAQMPLIMRQARVITVSESEKKAILNYYPRAGGHLGVVHNGGFGKRFEKVIAQPPPPRDPNAVLYVGAINRLKNPQRIIDAMALLLEKHPLHLTIAGGGGQSFRKNPFRIPDSMKNRVTFTGQIEDTQELIRLYQSAGIMVFPSFYEASPLPPIEAMACGCPVVAGDIPALRERCGEAAVFCQPGEVSSIAGALDKILSQPALARELSQKGLERAERFTWEACARQTLAIIREAGEKR